MTEKDDFKVVNSKGFMPNNKKQLADAIKGMVEMLPEFMEIQKLKAEYKKFSYDQYIKQGFTKTQALQIISTEKTPFDY